MRISELLRIPPGITALIGAGGKTTLMDHLAGELSERGSVIVSTSTRIMKPVHLPVLSGVSTAQLAAALRERRVLCVGSKAEGGKLSAPPVSFGELARLADYVLVEADGAHCLPIKAHADYEPVIPPETKRTVLVLGADAFGRPIDEICHRPGLFARIAGVDKSAAVTSELAARVITAEGLGECLYINKVEDETTKKNALRLAELLDLPVTAGSLKRGEYLCLR